MPKPAWVNVGSCACDGCEKPAKTTGLCRMHYSRKLRYGTLDLSRKRKKLYTHTQGYLVEHDPSHPLANSAGEIYQHRKVFYEHHGSGPFTCFGCLIELTWETIHIDHIDEVKTNNAISNLRAACPGCNTARSSERIINTRRAKTGLFYNGVPVTVADLARIKGMTYAGMSGRLKKMSLEEAMSYPKNLPTDARPWRVKRAQP